MNPQLPQLETARTLSRLANHQDVLAILNYYRMNQAHLTPYEPSRPANFYTAAYWQQEVQARVDDFAQGRSLRLFLFEKQHPKVIIGALNLNNIVHGVFQACSLGYSLAATKQGQGYMGEALVALMRYGFEDLNLHRIMAAYMPRNHRSGNLLKRLGFQIEGVARDYVCINGQWEDHILTSLVNPMPQCSGDTHAH
ncbi:MAG: GNAT family N-acetyltransferase [Cyanobacteria bacterium P01_A01_bin.123]